MYQVFTGFFCAHIYVDVKRRLMSLSSAYDKQFCTNKSGGSHMKNTVISNLTAGQIDQHKHTIQIIEQGVETGNYSSEIDALFDKYASPSVDDLRLLVIRAISYTGSVNPKTNYHHVKKKLAACD